MKKLHIDMFLETKPEVSVEILSHRSKEELETFRKELHHDFHTKVQPLIIMAKKQLRAFEGDDNELAKINANLFVISTLAQKIEDIVTIINTLLSQPK